MNIPAISELQSYETIVCWDNPFHEMTKGLVLLQYLDI
jgi:hypothetical protein